MWLLSHKTDRLTAASQVWNWEEQGPHLPLEVWQAPHNMVLKLLLDTELIQWAGAQVFSEQIRHAQPRDAGSHPVETG